MDKKQLSAFFQEMIQFENVVGVGRGYKWVRGENTGRKSAVVLVKKKIEKAALTRQAMIPNKIGGITTDVIEVGDIRLLEDRTGLKRPACPGISIGHYKVSAGTFGAVVRDRTSGEILILSNNHVLANLSNGSDERAKQGDVILQPGMYDGGDLKTAVIGHLERFIPLYSEVNPPRCRIAKLFEDLFNKCFRKVVPKYRIQVLRENDKVNLMDCAVATPVSSDDIDENIFEIGKVVGIEQPSLSMLVKKSGRSSGLTFSLILATDVTVRVGITKSESGIFADQILAGPMSMPGDSGSLVLTEDNYAVGLLFAGSEQVTMFSPIDRICEALNITF